MDDEEIVAVQWSSPLHSQRPVYSTLINGKQLWSDTAPAEPTLHLQVVDPAVDQPSIVMAVDHQGQLAPVPPFDAICMDLDSLEPLIGVNISWATTYFGSPLGECAVEYRVVDGIPIDISGYRYPPTHGELRVDVTFRTPFQRYLRMRLGEIEPAESIGSEGSIVGDLDQAMVIAGLLDDNWFRAHPASPELLRNILRVTKALRQQPLLLPPP